VIGAAEAAEKPWSIPDPGEAAGRWVL